MRARLIRLLALVALGLGARAASGAEAQDAAALEGPTLVLGGDVIHDAPLEYAVERFFAGQERAAFDLLFADVAPLLADADLSIVNLETPVGPRHFDRDEAHDLPTFTAPAAFAESLAAAGVDVVTLANNHAYDQGVSGLGRTLAELERVGLREAGAGVDGDLAAAPTVVRVGRDRIAIVSLTQGTNRRVVDEDPSSPRIAIARVDRVAQAARAARAAGELAIVALHFTGEDDRPTRTQRALARAAAEGGADLVVAHGPHRPMPLRHVRTSDGRRVPFVVLGNLVAAMEAEDGALFERAPGVRDALLARVTTRRHGERLEVDAVSLTPLWIDVARRPWSADEPGAMVRPRALTRELERLEASSCGRRCARWAQGYRQRAEMLAALEQAPREERAAPSDARVALSPARAARVARAEIDVRPAPEPASIALSELDPASRRARRERAAATLRAPAGASRERLQVRFAVGSSTPLEVDQAALASLVARLLADRALRVEIRARSREGEARSLALARARRVRALLAVRGPSRARFGLVDAGQGDPDTVELRVWRLGR